MYVEIEQVPSKSLPKDHFSLILNSTHLNFDEKEKTKKKKRKNKKIKGNGKMMPNFKALEI